jgi:hypothetical protein
MNVNAGQFAALRNLCLILNVPLDSTRTNMALALRLLTLTYALPMIRERAQVRAAGNQILAASQPDFDKWGPFVGSLGRNIATMQELPAHFNTMRLKPNQLALTYKRLTTINWILETVGLVGGAGAATAGAADVIKTGSLREGAKKAGARLVGKGAISEALVSRYGPKAGPRAAGLALVAAAVAKLVHESGKKQMAEIRAIMQHEYQSGRARREDYAAVYGNAVDPGAIKRYWQYQP